MEHFLLFVAFLCFFFSGIVRWKNLKKHSLFQKELYSNLFQYLNGLSDIKPEQELFESCSIVSFYRYYLAQTDNHPPQTSMEDRWESLSLYFSDLARLNHSFVKKNTQEKLAMLKSFSVFPLYSFHCFCLNWIIRNHCADLLSEALKQCSLGRFAFSWNLSWLALAFLNKIDTQLLSDMLSASTELHMEAQYDLHCKEINFGLWEQDIKKNLLDYLCHHEALKQDLGIYGLGFFRFSGVSEQLVSKLDGASKERFLLIMRSLRKLEHPVLPESLYQWVRDLSYPPWETMQEVYDFFKDNGENGKKYLARLRQEKHAFWQNFFRDRSLNE